MKPIGLISSLYVFMERDSLISCAEILMNVLLGLHANIFSLLVFSRKRQDILQSKVVILALNTINIWIFPKNDADATPPTLNLQKKPKLFCFNIWHSASDNLHCWFSSTQTHKKYISVGNRQMAQCVHYKLDLLRLIASL